MSTSADADGLERWFTPISLESLNAKAAMLERLDNKYVVDASILSADAPIFAQHFDVLEIDGRRTFTYETCYFDSIDLRSYFDHHQGRRRRAKVRMRAYKEAKLCFVEVKLKDKRGITVKKQMAYEPRKFGVLDDTALAHIQTSYRSLYDSDFPYQLVRTLDLHYVRMTLAAKEGGERMTIDSALRFVNGDRIYVARDNLFIIETKSANGNGIADQILRKLHQHSTKHFSKYCAGIALMHEGIIHNNFCPALKKLRHMAACGD
jgi:VTC domain